MQMSDAMSKADLLANMAASRDELRTTVDGIPDERWGEGRYEEGWTARDILAHVASIEWTFPRILDIADEPERPSQLDPAKPANRNIGDYNQRQVAKRADATVPELLEEFERNRAATIAAVEEAGEDLLRERVRSAGGIEGTAAEVLNYLTTVHLRNHLDDIGRTT
jgi:uncharacterized protein (TIGR03083 family)